MTAVLLVAASPGPRDVNIQRNSALLQFEYQWSREAAAVAPLNRELRGKADAAYRQALDYARDDHAAAKHDKRPFHQHSYDASWETLGQTARLLSIAAEIEAFSGGAHPNHNVDAQLWDRRVGKQMTINSLFIQPGAFEKLTRTRYCKALDKERQSRRDGEKLDGMFDECPKFSDLSIAPRDRQPNGRFETIEFLAAPYIAGPYVEGEYAIDLPVTRQMTAAIKPVYRPSFEPQRQ